MSDLLEELNTSRFQRQSGTDYNFSIEPGKGAGFTPPQEVMNDNNISLPSESEPRTEPLSEEEMQAYRDAAKAKGIDFDGFIMPTKGTGRSRGNDFLTSKIMAAGKAAGLNFDEYEVRSIANDIFGNPAAENFSDQIGLVDFLGIGAFYGAEEGANTAKGGYNQYREYLDKLDSGEAEPQKFSVPGAGMTMDLGALQAGSDMVMGGVEAGLNAVTSFPALRGTYLGAKNLGRKVLQGARTRKSNRPGGTTLRTGITGEDVDDAIVAVGDLLTREIDQDELGFYSKLLEETKKLKQENWNAKDLQNTLKNINGVKPDEMRWTGLDDFLSKNKKVTKQEVIDHLKENRIQIKEVKQGGVDASDYNVNDNYYEDAFDRFSDQQIIDLEPEDLQNEVNKLLDEYTTEPGSFAAKKTMRNIRSGENRHFFDASPSMGDHIIYNENYKSQSYSPYRLSDEFENALNNGATKFTTSEGETIDLSDALQTEFEKIANDDYLQTPLYKWHDPESDYYIVGREGDGFWITQGNHLWASRLESTLQGPNNFDTYDEAVIQATQTADDRGLINPSAVKLDGETDPSGVPFDAPSEFKDYLPTEGGENYREFLLVNNNFKGDDDFVNLNVEINSKMQRMLALDEQAAKASLPNINPIDRGPTSQADNIVLQEFSALQAERKKVFNELQPLLRQREKMLGAEKDKYPVEKAKQMESFNKSHFKEDNVIANILIDDRKTLDGKKVLYIHELQSDWGQKGGGRQNTLQHRAGFATKENLSLKEMGNKKSGRAADDFFIEYKRITGFPIEDYPEFQEMLLNDSRTRRKITFPSKVWMSATDAERANLDPRDHFIPRGNTYDIDYQGLGDTDDVIPEGRLLRQSPEGLATNPFPGQKLTKFFRDYIDGIAEKDMTIIPKGPLVENTDQWTQMSMRRIIRYATENGYDYVAWTPGDVVSKRWNKPGLGEYYNKVIPKNSKEVLKKLDKKAKVEVIELPMIDRNSWPERDGEQKTLAIPITDAIRSSAPKGQPLFTPIAATAVGGGLAAQSMNQEQQ